MQTYDIQISSASDVERIYAQGDYIYYLNGSAGGSCECIEVSGINTGFRVKLKPGQGMRLPAGQVEKDWLIKPDDSIAGGLLGEVVVGQGEIFDNRITGDVSVIDTARNQVLSDLCYHTNAYQSEVAGNTPTVGVWNPPGSGKNMAVKITAMGGFVAASQFYMRRITGPIAGWVEIVPQNKNVGSAAIPAHKIIKYSGPIQGIATTYPGMMATTGVTQNVPVVPNPFVIKEGHGLIVHSDAGAGLAVHFMVEEF